MSVPNPLNQRAVLSNPLSGTQSQIDPCDLLLHTLTPAAGTQRGAHAPTPVKGRQSHLPHEEPWSGEFWPGKEASSGILPGSAPTGQR